MLNRFLQLLFISLVIILAQGGSGQAALVSKQDNGLEVLRSASENDYPPFAIIQENGRPDGFSVELLKEVVAVMGGRIHFTVGSWSDIKKQLVAGQLDVLPLVSYSPGRDKTLDFSVPYIHMHGAIFVRKDSHNIHSEADLRNREVVVKRDDTAHEYALSHKLTDHLIFTENYSQAFTLLSQGKYDAILVQDLVGQDLIKILKLQNIIMLPSVDKTSFHLPNTINTQGFEQKFCFAVPKGNIDLLAQINEGLAIVIANGTYERLQEKWLTPLQPVTSASVKATLALIVRIAIPLLLLFSLMVIWFFKRQLRNKTAYLRQEIESHAKTSQQRLLLSNQLDQRLRELHYLYELNTIAEQYQANQSHLLPQAICDFFPKSWHNLPSTVVRITIVEQIYSSGDGAEEYCCLCHDIVDGATKHGTLEIWSPRHKNKDQPEIFLPEEKKLISSIMARLGRLLTLQQVKHELQHATEIINKSPVVAFSWDNEENWPARYVSTNVEQLTGYSTADFLDQNIFYKALIHQDDLARVSTEVQESCRSGLTEFSHAPYRIITKQGDIRWLDDHTCIIRDEQGQVTSFHGLVLDITARKEAEQELRLTAQRMKSILQTTSEGFLLLDNELRILEMNQAICQIFGKSPEVISGKCAVDFMDKDQQPLLKKEAQKRNQGISSSYEFSYTKDNGEKIYLRNNASPLFGENGVKTGTLSLLTDITKEKVSIQQLHEAQQAAETANKAKSEFLANMSHEIRTPLNAIIGMGQLAMLNTSSPEQQHYLEVVQRSANVLLTLIDDILDFSKIEAGLLELDPQPFALDRLLLEIKESFQPQAKEKDLTIAILPPMPQHLALIGDNNRLRQILVNLIGNALKFTEQGEISLAVKEINQGQADEVVLQFSVRDSGIGIATDKQEMIFDKFSQANATINRNFGGSGLGLAISKKLCKLLGGSIWLESEEGKGSTFFFTATLRQAPALPEANNDTTKPVEVAVTPQTILLVEDQPFNQELAKEILQQQGHEVVCAQNGLEALEQLSNSSFDIILMDVQMPEMDGLEASRLIRLCEKSSPMPDHPAQELLRRIQLRLKTANTPIPIVAMTAFAQSDDYQKCLAAGMNEYISKPFQPEKLRQTITALARAAE